MFACLAAYCLSPSVLASNVCMYGTRNNEGNVYDLTGPSEAATGGGSSKERVVGALPGSWLGPPRSVLLHGVVYS